MNEASRRLGDVVVERLCRSWYDRATVRKPDYLSQMNDQYATDKTDFPESLVPFFRHPDFVALSHDQKELVRSLAWVAWNKRVVDTEELLVVPALMRLLGGATDIVLEGFAKEAIRQTMIDECFHSHMHDSAIQITLKGRGISQEVMKQLSRTSCSYRSYCEFSDTLQTEWEKDVARLAWVVVGELSIYEFLTLVSRDETVQPVSRKLVWLHEKDEAAHANVIAEVVQSHFHQLRKEQRACFMRCIPLAMTGFAGEDWEVWIDILNAAGVANAARIIEDTRTDSSIPGQLPLMRSYQKVDKFCESLRMELADAA